MHSLLARAATREYGVYVLGARAEILERAVARLREQYPDLAIVGEQLSRVVDEKVKHQAATSSSVVVSSSVTLMPSLNFTPSSTSVTSSWPLNRRQRSWAASRSL